MAQVLSSYDNEVYPIKLYTQPSVWGFLVNKPKWYIFEGNLGKANDLNEYVTSLSEILINAKKFIHVVGGELCSGVWNNPNIVNALETSKAGDISFICGPKLDILNHGLIRLAKKNKVHFIYTPTRQKEHFRVTDNGIFIEGYHEVFKPERNAAFCKNLDIINSIYNKKFNQIGADETVEKVKTDEILTKFDNYVFDPTVVDGYRRPSDSEISSVRQILLE